MSAGAAAAAAAAAATTFTAMPPWTMTSSKDREGLRLLTHDTAVQASAVVPVSSAPPLGYPAFSLQWNYQMPREAGEATNFRNVTQRSIEAMPNNRTATQIANSIVHVALALRAADAKAVLDLTDVGATLSPTAAVLATHTVTGGPNPVLPLERIGFSWNHDHLESIAERAFLGGPRHAHASWSDASLKELVTQLRGLDEKTSTAIEAIVNGDPDDNRIVHFQGVKADLRRRARVATTPESKAKPVMTAAAAAATAAAAAAAPVTIVVAYKPAGFEEKLDKEKSEVAAKREHELADAKGTWVLRFAAAMLTDYLSVSPLTFYDLDPMAQDFIRRLKSSQRARSEPDALRWSDAQVDNVIEQEGWTGTPLCPSSYMFGGVFGKPSAASLINMTLHHDADRPLSDAILECVCIRLIATAFYHDGHRPFVWFNDFAGRRFKQLGKRFRSDKPTTLSAAARVTLQADTGVRDLARVLNLPALLAVSTVGGDATSVIESWSAIRAAALTAPLRDDAFVQACVAWLLAVDGVRGDTKQIERDIRRLSWHESVMTHGNGMQTIRLVLAEDVRIVGSDEEFRLAFRAPVTATPRKVVADSLRRLKLDSTDAKDGRLTWAAVGAVPYLLPVTTQKLRTPLQEADKRLRAKVTPESSVPAVVKGGRDSMTQALLSPSTPVTELEALSIVLSQPSRSNVVVLWSVMHERLGNTGQRIILVNDWLGTWAEATGSGSEVIRVAVPSLMTADAAIAARMIKDNNARWEATYARLDALDPGNAVLHGKALPKEGSSVAIVVNCNWGPNGRDLYARCAHIGKFLGNVMQTPSAASVFHVCVLLPGRKVASAQTNKRLIGSYRPPVRDTDSGEAFDASFASAQLVPTVTPVTIYVRAILDNAATLLGAGGASRIAKRMTVYQVPLGPISAIYFTIWKHESDAKAVHVQNHEFQREFGRAWSAASHIANAHPQRR
jgi:hypothetical protein